MLLMYPQREEKNEHNSVVQRLQSPTLPSRSRSAPWLDKTYTPRRGLLLLPSSIGDYLAQVCMFSILISVSIPQRIYTDNEIYNPEELAKIESKMTAIEFCRRTIDDFPPDAHIVLNISEDELQETQCYCVNHGDRMVFFLSEFRTEWLQTWGAVEGAYSRHHFCESLSPIPGMLLLTSLFSVHELEAQYW